MKKFKNKFAVKFNDPVLGEAMKKKLIEIGHEWDGCTLNKGHAYILVNFFGGKNNCGFNQTPKHFDQKYDIYTLPQDWQKVIELASEEEKKWKVQEFRTTCEGKEPLMLGEDGRYWNKFSMAGFTLKSMLINKPSVESGDFSIHSVTDGNQVIAVGDDTDCGKVSAFIWKNNYIHVLCTGAEGDIESLDLKKVEKKPLFVTDDGVEIFNYAISVYGVNKKTFETLHTITTAYASERDKWKDWAFFSTEEARDEYILNNKHMFSLTDIRGSKSALNEIISSHNISADDLIGSLEQLAKQRLNK